MKKLRRAFLIVFAVAALTLALVACNETVIPEHNHQWSEWSADTATCTQVGTQTRTCTREGCNAQDGKPATETRTTAALGHNVTSWTLCEADHSKHEGVCSRTDCGVTVAEAHHANAAGTECVDCGEALYGSEQCLHPNASATSETAATCTSAKIEHWTCPDCVWTENRPVGSALGHDYINVAWKAVSGGKHERACARDCGDKQTDTCDSNAVITGSAATCVAAGRENGTKCSVCGGNEKEGAVINALDHKWSEWSENTATCTEGGTQTRTCTREGCNTNNGKPATETQTIGALGHKWSDWHDSTATCTTGGEHTRTCERDGCNTNNNGPAVETVETAALGHAWGEWGEDTATCTAGGTQNRTCTRVGCNTNDGQAAVDTRETEALGHDKYIVNETAATCTANKVEHWACSRGDWTEDKEIAETALGHDYADGAWTAASGGTHERECARDGCNYKQTENCDDDGTLLGTAATCATAGRENGTKCSVCGGNAKKGAVIEALGHSLSVASTTAATCTAAQANHMACSRCDYTEDQTVGDILGHDYVNGAWTSIPDDGHHAVKCSRCDVLDVDNKHAAEWGEYGVTDDETQHYQICQHCDIQSAPADHSATTYTYAGNGEHSGECVCGKTVTEKCELADGSNACSACSRIVGTIFSVGTGSINFPEKYSAVLNSQSIKGDEIALDANVTIEFGGTGTPTAYYNNGTSVRMYINNTLTVSVKSGYITKIEFTLDSKTDLTYSGDNGTLTSGTAATWTSKSNCNSVVFGAGSDRAYIKTITVTYSKSAVCYHDDTVVACLQSAASCEGTGILQDCYHCESCNLYFTTDACTEILENAVVDALGHNYGEWIPEVAATCVAEGTKGHFRCDACGKDFDSEENEYAVLEDLTIAINPNNHSHLTAVAKQDATCDNVGWNAHYVCDGCGKKYETTDATEEYEPAIAPLGHDLQYRANGTDKHEQYCTRCDYVEEAAEHTATTWVAETDEHHQVCTVCGLDFNVDEHSYTDGVCVCGMEASHEHNYTGTVTKQPTCTEKGVTTYACDGCDNTYTEDIDALGHDFDGDVLPITDDATYHAVKCSRCDAFDVDNKAECNYTEDTVDADGHYTACVCGRIGSSTPHVYEAATQTCSCGKINPTYLVVVGSDKVIATFGMGTGSGTAAGSNQSTYSETASGYTLDITRKSGSMFTNAGDGNIGNNNSVLRLATSGVAASLSFEVPDNVIKVVMYVARYNESKAVQLTINGENVTSPTSAEYIPVTVDTRSVKTILLGADKYCYINTIEYWVAGQDHIADPDQTPSVTAASCANAGKVSFYCLAPDCTTLHEVVIPVLEHTYGEWIPEVAATCVATGEKGHFRCDACGNDFDSEKAVLEDLTIAINPNNHSGDLTHVDAQTATTCDTTDTEHAGHAEYWQCACGVMYADANRNTVIDSLELGYLDHTLEWTTKTDSGHSGECSVCNADIAEQQHVWNDANSECTVCGYQKPADKRYITTVIIVDGVRVDGIPAGVTLTWDPADANGAFDAGEGVSLEISLSGYNLVGVVVTDGSGNEAEDWMVEDGLCMGDMNDDYTLTITIVSIPTVVVNYSVDNATVTVTDGDGTTINSGDRVLVGTELTVTVTAADGYEVKGVTVNGTAVVDGKYTVAETDTAITIAATVEEKSNDPVLVATITATAMGYGNSYQNVTKTIDGYTVSTVSVMKQNGSGTPGNLQLKANAAIITITGAPIAKIEIVYSSGGKNITVKVDSDTISMADESTDSLWIYEVSVSDSETLTISNGASASYISEIRIYA